MRRLNELCTVSHLAACSVAAAAAALRRCHRRAYAAAVIPTCFTRQATQFEENNCRLPSDVDATFTRVHCSTESGGGQPGRVNVA
jgi:hypothetical protein